MARPLSTLLLAASLAAVAWLPVRPAHAQAAASRPTAAPADPPPLVTSDVLDVTLRWTNGRLALASLRKASLGAPRRLPRFLGRFELRLVGAAGLLDVVRFDFPLLADAYSPEGDAAATLDRVAAHVTTGATVRVPFDPRIQTLEVRDRKTGAWIAFTPAGEPPTAPASLPAAARR